MAKQKSKLKIIVPAILIGIVAFVAFGHFSSEGLTRRGPMAYEDAARKLGGFMDDVTWREEIVNQVATVELQDTSLEDSLPAISTFPLVVTPKAGGALELEIFSSSEKAGSGTDGWMTEAAQDFNASDFRLGNGRQVQIRLRKIASGTGYQFIASRKYLPDAYTPSNHLWVRMAAARGATMTPVRERTVGNIAGIVMKSDAAQSLKQEVGELTVAKIVNAVVQGKLVTGYTNPYASSTGLNFLVTVLATFGDSDEARMLSPAVVSAFEEFQRGIPFVALTTLQMRDSVRRDGSLDAFVMEYQTFVKTKELASGYEFIPFGVAHDNPLYAVGNPDPAKREALELFAGYLERDKYKNLAGRYGFNPSLEHKPPFAIPQGETLISAQRIWKEKKDAGRPIAAVFVSDVSGSMRGSRLRELKRAVVQGAPEDTPIRAASPEAGS